MQQSECINFVKNNLGFSEKGIIKLRKFHDFLIIYNKKYNLISKNTENSIWTRHILDSAQLIRFFDLRKYFTLADLGSGAGFPGLILAIFSNNHLFHVKLYEKSPVKRNFLKRIGDELDIRFDLVDDVYKEKIVADVIVCRAFKKLPQILKISRENIEKPHKLIILKGKDAHLDIKKVSLEMNYRYKLEKSLTSDDSKIIIINANKKKN